MAHQHADREGGVQPGRHPNYHRRGQSTTTVWDAETGEPVLALKDHLSTSVAFSPDGTRIVTCGFDKTVKTQ